MTVLMEAVTEMRRAAPGREPAEAAWLRGRAAPGTLLPQRPLPLAAGTHGFGPGDHDRKVLPFLPGVFPALHLRPASRSAAGRLARSPPALTEPRKPGSLYSKTGQLCLHSARMSSVILKHSRLLFRLVVSGRWWRSPISREQGGSVLRPLCGCVTGNCSLLRAVSRPQTPPSCTPLCLKSCCDRCRDSRAIVAARVAGVCASPGLGEPTTTTTKDGKPRLHASHSFLSFFCWFIHCFPRLPE